MDDMISRQAALDALPKKQKGIGGESWMKTYRRSGYNDCVEDCMKALQALPSVQPGWIPCDVRTPKYVEESYWICTDTGYQCQCRWTNDVWGLGASDKWAWKLLDIPQYSRVVAWMPLPKPYREGGQG